MGNKPGSFLKYSASSVICFLLDYGLFTLLNAVLLRGVADGARELIATYGARIVSAVVNFLLNRNLVFHDASDPRRAAVRYTLLAIAQAAVSALLVYAGPPSRCRWTSRCSWPAIRSRSAGSSGPNKSIPLFTQTGGSTYASSRSGSRERACAVHSSNTPTSLVRIILRRSSSPPTNRSKR